MSYFCVVLAKGVTSNHPDIQKLTILKPLPPGVMGDAGVILQLIKDKSVATFNITPSRVLATANIVGRTRQMINELQAIPTSLVAHIFEIRRKAIDQHFYATELESQIIGLSTLAKNMGYSSNRGIIKRARRLAVQNAYKKLNQTVQGLYDDRNSNVIMHR